MINDLGEVMMMTWAKMGLKIENQIETQESLIIYISVPEFSNERNVRNEEMSGMRLAKRFKDTFIDMSVKRLTVKAKIRSGEHWTKEMGARRRIESAKNVIWQPVLKEVVWGTYQSAMGRCSS